MPSRVSWRTYTEGTRVERVEVDIVPSKWREEWISSACRSNINETYLLVPRYRYIVAVKWGSHILMLAIPSLVNIRVYFRVWRLIFSSLFQQELILPATDNSYAMPCYAMMMIQMYIWGSILVTGYTASAKCSNLSRRLRHRYRYRSVCHKLFG